MMNSKHIRRDSTCMCVVCCEEVEFYAIGQCDHPVCYKCCVRMRVLGRENYCAVCRADLETVLLTKDYGSWDSLKGKASKSECDRKYGILYSSREIREMVKQLLQHRCPKCPDRKPEHSFEKLQDHTKKTHQLYYCRLCVKYHSKFSHERKAYTRHDLARHRRIGDVDDTSHKGHPLCEFCEERFLDEDELHRHLRKNHFWCHFCERDGRQLYYRDYPNLREHFRDEHLLCEEDECCYEQFTSVFRTDIDLQVHRAAKHAKKLTKAQVRQARQVEVDITFNPRPAQGRNISGRDYSEVRSAEHRQRYGKGRARGNVNGNSRKEDQELQTAVACSLTAQEQRTPSPPAILDEPPTFPVAKKDISDINEGQNEFPSLCSSSDIPKETIDSKASPKPTKKTEPPKTSSRLPYKQSTSGLHSMEEFPSLGGGTRTIPSGSPPPGFSTAAKKAPPGFSQGPYQKKPPPGFQRPPTLPLHGQSDSSTEKESTAKNKIPQSAISQRLASAPCGSRKENVAPSTELKTPMTKPVADGPTESSNRHGRNQALIENIKALLGYDKDKFVEFKTLSGTFRQGLCSAQEYYTECTRLFEQNFAQVFTELVALLPDLEKQQKLLRVHNDAKILAEQQGKKVTKDNDVKKNSAWAVQPDPPVKPVPNLISTSRGPPGVRLDNDFPSLPSATATRHIRPAHSGLYRPTNAALKSAWVRGK